MLKRLTVSATQNLTRISLKINTEFVGANVMLYSNQKASQKGNKKIQKTVSGLNGWI